MRKIFRIIDSRDGGNEWGARLTDFLNKNPERPERRYPTEQRSDSQQKPHDTTSSINFEGWDKGNITLYNSLQKDFEERHNEYLSTFRDGERERIDAWQKQDPNDRDREVIANKQQQDSTQLYQEWAASLQTEFQVRHDILARDVQNTTSAGHKFALTKFNNSMASVYREIGDTRRVSLKTRDRVRENYKKHGIRPQTDIPHPIF